MKAVTKPASPDASAGLPAPATGTATYFDNPAIDALFNICLELGSAVWVTRDRLRVLEAILAEQGIATDAAIEAYRMPPEAAEKAREERDEFIQRLFGGLKDL
jgi:hypothetical protein